MHGDPVGRGVGGHAGVVPAVAGGGVGDGEPSLCRVNTVCCILTITIQHTALCILYTIYCTVTLVPGHLHAVQDPGAGGHTLVPPSSGVQQSLVQEPGGTLRYSKHDNNKGVNKMRTFRTF